MQKTPVSIKLLSFIPFVFGYLWLVDKGFVVIGPCDGTPGYEYTVGYILLALFPLIAGVLLFFCLHKSKFTKRAKYWLSSFVPSGCLLLGGILTFGGACMLYKIEPRLEHSFLWHVLFERGCYNDTELRMPVLITFVTLFFYLLLALFFRMLARK